MKQQMRTGNIIIGILMIPIILICLSIPVYANTCSQTYVVQPGDILGVIALRTGVSISELARLNHITNIDFIVVGQILCLAHSDNVPTPQPPVTPTAPPTPMMKAFPSNFDLVVHYVLNTTNDVAASWNLGQDGQIGKRQHYPLPSGDEIQAVPNTIAVRQSSNSYPPIFWIVPTTTNLPEDDSDQPRSETITYTLVAIGNPAPLLDLQIEGTRTITDLLPLLPTAQAIEEWINGGNRPPDSRAPVMALGGPNAISVTLEAEWVSWNGIFKSIPIAAIDYQADPRAAQLRYEPAFALHRANTADQNGYHLVLVLTNKISGPPDWRQQCQSWNGGGWWFGFLSYAYGC